MKKYTTLKFTLLLSLCLIFKNSYGQRGYVWKSLGTASDSIYYDPETTYKRLVLHKYIDGNYYTLLHIGNNYVFSKWDGTSWNKLPTLKLKTGTITDFTIFNNELYISGNDFDSVKLAQRPGDLAFAMLRFDGTKWDSIPGNPPSKDSSDYAQGTIDNLTAWNGKLYYLSHVFNSKGRQHKLYEMTTSGVHKLIQSYDNMVVDGTLAVHNNQLVWGGSYDTLEFGKPSSGIAIYNGSSFSYPSAGTPIGVEGLRNTSVLTSGGMHSVNDSILVFISSSYDIMILKNGNFINLNHPDPFFASGVASLTSIDNKIIPSENYKVQDYYDLDSNKWKRGVKERLILTNSGNGNVFGFRYNNNFPPSITDFVQLVKGSIVSGTVYIDKDSSCAIDTGDRVLKNTLIELNDGTKSYFTNSDHNGYYEINVLPATYSVNYLLPNAISALAPCSSVSVVVSKIDTTINGIDIPVHISKYRNLGVSFTATRGFKTRQGFTENYQLNCGNYSYKKDSIIVKLTYDSKSNFISSDVTPYSNSANQIIYKFYNLDWNDQQTIHLQFSTSTSSSSLGNIIKFHATILNSVGDSMPSNNVDSLLQKVVSSYDPNIKECFPEGKIKPGLKKIKYVIHFQNTGKDTAFKVTVVDTITQKIGLRSIRVTGTSHSSTYALRVENNQTLIWEFKNILLPDSHTNEKASHGYIAFEADINSELAVGDSITNKAYIYFDYQVPVITNIASVVIVNSTNAIDKLTNSKGIDMYPNPSNSIVNINTKNSVLKNRLLIYNMMGDIVASQNLQEGKCQIDLHHLAKGIYIVRIEGTELSSKLVIE